MCIILNDEYNPSNTTLINMQLLDETNKLCCLNIYSNNMNKVSNDPKSGLMVVSYP